MFLDPGLTHHSCRDGVLMFYYGGYIIHPLSLNRRKIVDFSSKNYLS